MASSLDRPTDRCDCEKVWPESAVLFRRLKVRAEPARATVRGWLRAVQKLGHEPVTRTTGPHSQLRAQGLAAGIVPKVTRDDHIPAIIVANVPLLDRFRQHLHESQLIPSGSRILVGYSGGADSTCLLDMCRALKLDIVAAHLHHGQRAEAELERKLCEGYAESIGVPFVTGNADVPSLAADFGIGLEEAGRRARYAFFEQAAGRLGCNLTATAHTLDDHVETILLHLARGTGLSGLAGIPERRVGIVRPLLPFGRTETRGYCTEHGLWFHDDPANSNLDFSRARIRHRVVPELRAINPEVDAAISRLGAIASEEDRFLNGAAAAALEQSEMQLNGDLFFLTEDAELCFDRARLSSVPTVLFRRAMRLSAEALGSNFDYDQVRLICEGVAHDTRGSVTAEGGEVVVEWSDTRIHLRNLFPTEPFRFALTVPGDTLSDEFGWQFTAEPAEASTAKPERASLTAEIDRMAVKGPLYFRGFEPGDTIQPLGFGRKRKLADLLSEAKLTHACRKRLPIVCDLRGPLWAPGVCLDERARARSPGSPVLRITFQPLSC